MSKELSVQEAAELFTEAESRTRSDEGRAFRPPALRDHTGGLSLDEGAAIVSDLISTPAKGKVVDLRRRRKLAKKEKGELSVDEGAAAIGSLLSEPAPPSRASKAVSAKPTKEDAALAERRGEKVAEVKLKQSLAQQTMTLFQQQLQHIAQEFADIRTHADLANLAQSDPSRHERFRAHQNEIQKVWMHVQAIAGAAEVARKEVFDEFAQDADDKFNAANPDWQIEHSSALVELLKEGDLSEVQIANLWAGNGGVPLTSAFAQRVIADATRYRTGENLEIYHELYDACLTMMRELGFTNEELNALGSGAVISLRDHRIQQIIADATRYRMEGRPHGKAA